MTLLTEAGWHMLPQLLSVDQRNTILAGCAALLTAPEGERHVGDKPHAGTHHLVELDHRVPAVKSLLEDRELTDLIAAFIGPTFEQLQVSYRSPQPGFGAQKLHADGLPKLDDGPELLVTAIIPLVDFTSANGATRIVPGSHRRPDLQRLAGNLDAHPDEIRLTGPAGCAFVFSGHLLHSGTRNDAASERPALQLQWQRAD